MRVVLVTLGSWGDLFPLVGVGRALAERGDRVTVAASPAYERFVAGTGLGFAGIGEPIDLDTYAAHPEILSGGLGGFTGFRAAIRRFALSQVDTLVDELTGAAAGADAVVTHPAHPAGPIVADRLGLPLVTATVFPSMIATATAPPGVRVTPALPGGLDRWVNRRSWATARTLFRRAFDGPVNEARRRVGLEPVRDAIFGVVERSRLVLVLASPHVVVPPPDWPDHVAVTGFVRWAEPAGWAVPGELEAFLAAGPPPVLVTLGSSGALDPGDFFARAVGAARAQGRRVVALTGPVLTGPALTGPADRDGGTADAAGSDDPDVCRVAIAPYAAVIPRCAAVVHHGGVGTAAACWRAGVPQLVVPRAFDQPVTAGLVERSGCGRSVPWARATGAALQAGLGRLLDDDDDAVRRRAGELAAAMADEDGGPAAADRLHAALG